MAAALRSCSDEQVRGKQPPSLQKVEKNPKPVLSSASLQSPLLQALLLQRGGKRFFLIPFVIQQGKGRSWAV